jgi:hypothetical protein
MLKNFKIFFNFNQSLNKINGIRFKQIKADNSTKPLNLSPKKLEDKLKKQVLFYIDNELPDKQLDNDLKPLKTSIKTQVYIFKVKN